MQNKRLDERGQRYARILCRIGTWQARGAALTGALPMTRRLRLHGTAAARLNRRRGAGVVERGGLENRCALTSTEGSNPSLSATYTIP